MKKLTYILAITICTTANAFAGAVSADDAQTVAVNFYKQKLQGHNFRGTLAASLKYTRTETDGTLDFYVYDFAPIKGFVIVSADDNLVPIIAYSTEKNFNSNFLNTGLNNWMNHASSHIYKAIKSEVQASQNISHQWNSYRQGADPGRAKSLSVGPLLSTAWGQDTFYNQYCPYNSTGHQTCEAGCVAVAMGQIMKYWNFPAQGTGSASYDNVPPNYLWNYGVQSANFAVTNYNWNAMPNQLTDTNSSVATLLYQCGVGVEMSYGDWNQGGSGAYSLQSEAPSWKYTAEYAYKNFFSYNANTLRGAVEANYNPADWVNLLEAELNQGRPVQYIGYDTLYGGHAWVCDGYDDNGLFHMNWGWNGNDNGYFSLSSLCAAGFNFSGDEAALIGIQPNIILPVEATATQSVLCKGENVMLISRGPAHSTYQWLPAEGLSCPTCPTTSASPSVTTQYILTVDSADFSTSDSVIVYVKTAPGVDTILTANVRCNGGVDGSIQVLGSGNDDGFSYLWSTGANSTSISNLQAGAYSLTITDTTGCTLLISETVTEPAALSLWVSSVNATCNNLLGSAKAHITGGTPGYLFTWSNSGSADSLSNLASGVYEVTVSDMNQCSASAGASVTKQNPIEVIMETGNGYAKVQSVENGAAPYSYIWNNGDTVEEVVNVAPAVYSVTVTDKNGCFQSAAAVVSADSIPTSIQNTSFENTFTIYPTLATTRVIVELGGIEETTLTVRNGIGQVLISKQVSSDHTTLDVSSFASGMYFVQAEQDGKALVRKFVVKR